MKECSVAREILLDEFSFSSCVTIGLSVITFPDMVMNLSEAILLFHEQIVWCSQEDNSESIQNLKIEVVFLENISQGFGWEKSNFLGKDLDPLQGF